MVLPLTSEERDTDTSVASPTKTAGNETPARVSTAAPFASKVEITRSLFAATANDGRMRPEIVHTTAELEDAKPVPLTAILKNGLL